MKKTFIITMTVDGDQFRDLENKASDIATEIECRHSWASDVVVYDDVNALVADALDRNQTSHYGLVKDGS